MSNNSLTAEYRKYVAGEYTLEEWQKRTEAIYEQAKHRTVKGVSGTYTAEEIAAEYHDRRCTAVVIADSPDLLRAREVLMVSPVAGRRVEDEHLAVFQGSKLADVYLARLRKKGIVAESFVIVELPLKADHEALTSLYRRVDRDIADCHCDDPLHLSPNFNAIETRCYFGDRYIASLSPDYPMMSADYLSYRGSRNGPGRVRWSVGRVMSREELAAREQQEQKRQEQEMRQRVEAFYAQDGDWISMHDEEGASIAVDYVRMDHGRIEAEWMTEDGKYRSITHTGGMIRDINAGRMITTREVVEGLHLDHKPVSAQEAIEALLTEERAPNHRYVLLKPALL